MSVPASDALVLFGVTGDLAHKMIFPALYALVKRGALKVPVVGVARPNWTPARLHARVKATGLEVDGAYYRFLRFEPRRKAELDTALEARTTNETYFFP